MLWHGKYFCEKINLSNYFGKINKTCLCSAIDESLIAFYDAHSYIIKLFWFSFSLCCYREQWREREIFTFNYIRVHSVQIMYMSEGDFIISRWWWWSPKWRLDYFLLHFINMYMWCEYAIADTFASHIIEWIKGNLLFTSLR